MSAPSWSRTENLHGYLHLGTLCRFHHQIKQHPRWHLAQPTPGTFTWTTPTGRGYTTQPDSHAA